MNSVLQGWREYLFFIQDIQSLHSLCESFNNSLEIFGDARVMCRIYAEVEGFQLQSVMADVWRRAAGYSVLGFVVLQVPFPWQYS